VSDDAGVLERPVRRLAVAVIVFFCAVTVPAGLLVERAWQQMRWQVFHQYRLMAETLTTRIDAQLRQLVEQEEARAFDDFNFAVAGGADGGRVRVSPLAAFPVNGALPGVIGHFQVDSAGRYSSPLVPTAAVRYADYGVSADEYAARVAYDSRMQAILGQPAARIAARADEQREAGPLDGGGTAITVDADPVADTAGTAPPASNVFERLRDTQRAPAAAVPSYGELAERKLDARLATQSRVADAQSAAAAPPAPAVRTSRREQAVLYAPAKGEMSGAVERDRPIAPVDVSGAVSDALSSRMAGVDDAKAATNAATAAAPASDSASTPRLRLFESELEPMSFARLDARHFVLFRNAWRDGERYIQGVLIDGQAFLAGAILAPWQASALAAGADLAIAWRGAVLALERADDGPIATAASVQQGELLYRARLAAPLAALELVYSVRELPLGASARYLLWVGAAMLLVLLGGCIVVYRASRGQLRLIRQQRDFVSAVSHELKTPLTAIRMYSEMLEAGWADDAKKATYYGYIRTESERLSRLIANVLTLGRMERGQDALHLIATPLGELMGRIVARIATQIEVAGFTLERRWAEDAASMRITVDEDALTQILINLVDNAIKFTPAGHPRRIELSCTVIADRRVRITLRDHGAGVPPAQMRHIFERFYRGGDELTRETVGTGIGLALVRELASAMRGTVTVENANPGAAFSLYLPCAGD